MTSAENSISEPTNLKFFGKDTPRSPYKACTGAVGGGGLVHSRPPPPPPPVTKNLATALLPTFTNKIQTKCVLGCLTVLAK